MQLGEGGQTNELLAPTEMTVTLTPDYLLESAGATTCLPPQKPANPKAPPAPRHGKTQVP